MSKMDVVDEAIIDAQPGVVCQAVLEELAGKSRWWKQYLESKPREGSPLGQEGMVCDVTVHGPLGIKSRFTQKIAKLQDGKSLDIDYIGGDFLGTAAFTFEPLDGKTRIRYRWMVQPNSLLVKMTAPVARNTHSKVMQKGYRLLNQYLKEPEE